MADGFVTVINIRKNESCTIKLRESLPYGMIQTFKLWEYSDGPPSLQERYDNLAQLSTLRDAFINEIQVRITHDPTSSKIQRVLLSKDASGFGPYIAHTEHVFLEALPFPL